MLHRPMAFKGHWLFLLDRENAQAHLLSMSERGVLSDTESVSN